MFTNINPHGEARVWRIGEPFAELASRFLPRFTNYSPISNWLQHKLGVTKDYRSRYDHLMLQLHDKMKADQGYQVTGEQTLMAFPAGSSWICFSDQTPHAAMSGQFLLEQTFLLPISAMKHPDNSPLQILEGLTQRKLI